MCNRTAMAMVALVMSLDSSSWADSRCAASDADIRNAIQEVHSKQENVGLSAAIVRSDQIVFEHSLGLANVEFSIPVDRDTRFGIASITKLYTAVTLLQFRAEGRIGLGDIVQEHLPDFPRKPEGDISLEMLALHTSGIPHPQSVRTPELYATHFDTATDAIRIFADEDLLFPPGTAARYSSSNYNLIAAILENVAGQNFKDLVAARIFEPLELSGSGFADVQRPLPNRASRYSYYHPWTYAESDELFAVPLWDYSFNPGGGNIVATAIDVARFGSALSSPGLLGPEELSLLHSTDWFGQVDDTGSKILYASGANPGVQAGLAVIPDLDIAASVLSNTWGRGSRSGEMTQLAVQLARLCAGTP